MASVHRINVSVVQYGSDRFFVTIGDTQITVCTTVEEADLILADLEIRQRCQQFGRRWGFKSIIGMKFAPRNMFDRRPAIFQLFAGRHCFLLPVIDQPIHSRLALFLISSNIKTIAMNMPDPGASCLGGMSVPWYDPWELALTRGYTDVQYLPLYGLAERVLGWGVVMPSMEEYTPEQVCAQWPPTPAWVTTLCTDVFLLQEIGSRLLDRLR